MIFFVEVVNRLYMDKLEIVACKVISYMIYFFYCLYDRMLKIGGRYSGKDFFIEIIEFVKSLCKSVDILRYLEKLKDKVRLFLERDKK